ncbi:MAG: hypothetical protein U0271_39240 [Polyangiaceae bacterium]
MNADRWVAVLGLGALAVGCANAEALSTSKRLTLVADVPLDVAPRRFDYQDFDAKRGYFVVAHMGSGEALVLTTAGALTSVLPGLPTARGVAVASERGRFFITTSDDEVVAFDSNSLGEVARFATGRAPDGVAYDAAAHLLGVSAQSDGALDLIDEAGAAPTITVALGRETGNVRFDEARDLFWIAVVAESENQLVSVSPAGEIRTRIALSGCDGAHGVLVLADTTALVACEDNATVLRVELERHEVTKRLDVGASPDVLAWDRELGLAYVAAESGDVAVLDVSGSSTELTELVHVGDTAHTVAVDPSTHRVYFPLVDGGEGAPVLRILEAH